MPESLLYEYAVVRYVPRVEREEFINVGLAMMCKRARWIRLEIHLDRNRLQSLAPSAPLDLIENQLLGFKQIAMGHAHSGPIGQYPPEERFRWLTAAKSACLQCSRPHPGLTDNLDITFENLFRELVL